MLLGGQRCDGNRAGSRRSPLAQSPPPSPPALKNMRSTRPADPQRTGNSGDVGPEELQLLSTCLESGQNGAPDPPLCSRPCRSDARLAVDPARHMQISHGIQK